jgi:hypothetical protein
MVAYPRGTLSLGTGGTRLRVIMMPGLLRDKEAGCGDRLDDT